MAIAPRTAPQAAPAAAVALPPVFQPGTLRTWLVVAFILLVPFQNTMLQDTPLRFLGASPAFAPLLGWILLDLMQGFPNKKSRRANMWLVALAFWCVVVSLGFLAWSSLGQQRSASFLLGKMTTNIVINLLFLYPVFNFPPVTPLLRKAVFAAFGITLLGYVAHDLLGLFQFPSVFQYSKIVTSPRGFSLELSTFAASVACLGLLSVLLASQRWQRGLFAAVTVAMVLVSLSKGTVIALFAAVFLGYVVAARRSIGMAVAMVLFVVVALNFALEPLLDKFSTDYEKYSSSSTRTTLVVASAISAVNNPLGVGYAGYIPALVEYSNPAMDFLSDRGFNVTADELTTYLVQDGNRGLNVKSALFEYLMIFGFPIVILLGVVHLRLLRGLVAIPQVTQRMAAVTAFGFAVVSLVTFMPAGGFYNFALVYAVLLSSIWYPVTANTEENIPNA